MEDESSDKLRFEQALECMSKKNFDDAVELLTEVLTFRCARYGEKSIECAPAFYHYGVALTHKAQSATKVACARRRLGLSE
jgi:hypothetical protein